SLPTRRSSDLGVGLEDIGAGLQVGPVDIADHRRLGQDQQIIVALQVPGPVRKAGAAEIRLAQLAVLDHGAHGAIHHQNALPGGLVELEDALLAVGVCRVQWSALLDAAMGNSRHSNRPRQPPGFLSRGLAGPNGLLIEYTTKLVRYEVTS